MASGARRRLAAALLVVAVATVHLWLADGVFESRLGEGAAERPLPRIEVAFVRQLTAAAPPAVVRKLPRAPRVRPAPAVVAAASASVQTSEPVSESAPAASAPELASAAEAAASAPAQDDAAFVPAPVASAPEAAASAPPAFEWPPSTRLVYALTGNYRGPVEGQAQVEWLRDGGHYQVRLEVTVGPPFAPLVTRRFTSDGAITEQGLTPQRYDQITKVAFSEPRGFTIRFDGARVWLPNGRELPQPLGVQDTASQFVQLTWLFTTHPELLQPGHSVEIPLALPSSVSLWTYDVIGPETLYTDFGAVETVHVKPRREPRPGLEMTVELWIAPSYQYLPLRSRINVDAETYAELLIKQLPQQAAPGR